MDRQTFTRALFLSVLLAGLTTLPLSSAVKAAPDRAFLGLTQQSHDSWYYVSFIEQVRGNRPVVRNLFDPDGKNALPFNLFFHILGWTARWTGYSSMQVYNVSRVILAPLVAIALLWLVSFVLETPGQRLLAVAWILFGTGFGWCMSLFFYRCGPRPLWPMTWIPVDLWMPEAHLFTSSLNMPHMVAGTLCFTWAMALMLRARGQPSLRNDLFTGLVAMLAGFVHIFTNLVVLAVRTGTFFFLEDPRPPLARWKGFAATMVPALCPLLYTVTMVYPDKSHANWAAAAQSSPSPLHFVLGLGVVALLAIYQCRRETEPAGTFLVYWAGIQALLLYTGPMVPFERRFVEGLEIPLVLLGIRALLAIQRPRLRAVAIALALAVSLPTGLSLLWQQLQFHPDDVWYFRSVPEYAGLAAIATRTPPEAIVLCSPDNGMVVPALASRAVVVGHMALTPDYEDRSRVVEQFFAGRLPVAQAKKLLKIFHVTHVYWGERESQYGAPPPALAPALEAITGGPGHGLFRVRSL